MKRKLRYLTHPLDIIHPTTVVDTPALSTFNYSKIFMFRLNKLFNYIIISENFYFYFSTLKKVKHFCPKLYAAAVQFSLLICLLERIN